MRLPRIPGRQLLKVGVLPVALLGTAAVVAGSSYSVFTSTTSSPTNSFASGSVVLTNDSASSSGAQASTGAALFTVTGLTPTSTAVQKCVTVQSTGTAASAVKLYATNTSTTNNLAQYLNVTVEVGSATNTNAGSCGTFSASSTIYASSALSSFETSYQAYGTGLATGWSPTGTATESKAFRITVQPNSSTMTNTQQSSRAQLDFVWEADNT